MRVAWMRRWAVGASALLAMSGSLRAAEDGQNPGLLGRIFRMGGGGSSGSGSSTQPTPPASRLPYGGSTYNTTPANSSAFGNTLPPGGSTIGSTPGTPTPAPLSSFGGLPETPPASSSGGPADRLTPRSRVSQAVTTADPLLTRFALGKSNDGSTFGMFLQVFADGTIVDSEGVHHVRPADLKPIVEVIQSGEIYRVQGHCGAPSTDFIEYVHLVVYQRRLGRLQAHSLSYSGNPQGCDHVIRHMHNAIENLQTKISRPSAAAPVAGGASPAPASSPAIPLTPAN